MSAQPSRHGRPTTSTPLSERSQSQNNTLAIRIVPYSPPRLDPDDRTPSQASSRAHAGSRCSDTHDDSSSRRSSTAAASTTHAAHSRRPSWRGENTHVTESYGRHPGSALSSPTSSSVSLARAKEPFQGEGVSSMKPPLASPSSAVLPGPSTALPLRSSSQLSSRPSAATINAPSSQHPYQIGESPSPSPSPAPSPGLRPLSRRANYVAVHSDKTFSLVRRGGESDVSASIASPPLSYSSRTSSAQDRPSIGAWSDGRASTPLTAATLPDQSLCEEPELQPLSQLSSPASSTTHLADDPITSSPWNYRMVGGLRKVPKTPDLKQKNPVHDSAAASTASETPLAPLSEASVYSDDDDDKIDDENKAHASDVDDDDDSNIVLHSRDKGKGKDIGGDYSDSDDADKNIIGLSQFVTPVRKLAPKTSFASIASSVQTLETISESTNYKVYGLGSSATREASDDSLGLPTTGQSNWEVLGESSPAPHAFPSSPPFSSSPPATSYSDENYVLHGDPSPSPSSSLATVSRQPRPTYSQESLRVAPLRPAKKRSNERLGYYKQRSRENLRARAGSLHSLKSISSVISTQDPTQVFLAAPVFVNFGATSTRGGRGGAGGGGGEAGPSSQSFPWSIPPVPSVPGLSGSSVAQSAAVTQRPPVPMIQAHPHQWSSQLSTVMSESEDESERGQTRSVSPLSDSGNGSSHRRRSSTGWASSTHSRQLLSISSSLAAQLEEGAASSGSGTGTGTGTGTTGTGGTGSGTGSDSIDRPQPTYSRPGPSHIRMVRDQDEHGDGLADLEHQPSRSGLSGFFSSANTSSRNLHSSGSSRANSFNSNIPAWARVYYGSGERRFLGHAPSIRSLRSARSETYDSRPGSSAFPGSDSSPRSDQFPTIFSPRRRPREAQGHLPLSDQESMEITPAPPQDYGVLRTLKHKTSSIWSPHLRMDRRATVRYSVWDPPSVSWSADTSILGKRNAQVVLFVLGFIFPFAWMIAAVLPLPSNPNLLEKNSSQSEFNPSEEQVPRRQRIRPVDDATYASARWWRNLNRIMSVIGLLIIGAIIALVVIGVRQGWGR